MTDTNEHVLSVLEAASAVQRNTIQNLEPNYRHEFVAKLRAAAEHIGELEDRLNKLVCAYCGTELPRGGDKPLVMANHVSGCEDHPMHAMSIEMVALRAEVERLTLFRDTAHARANSEIAAADDWRERAEKAEAEAMELREKWSRHQTKCEGPAPEGMRRRNEALEAENAELRKQLAERDHHINDIRQYIRIEMDLLDIDDPFPDDLHLGDVVEKRLMRPVHAELEDLRKQLAEAEKSHEDLAAFSAQQTMQIVERDARIVKLEGLLEEASGMLCLHASLKELGGRAWCGDCNQYLRTNEERTLNARIDTALNGASAQEARSPTPHNIDLFCRDGHAFVTDASDPGRCWCGADPVPVRVVDGTSLGHDLALEESANPAVASAADELDRVTASILDDQEDTQPNREDDPC